MGKTVNENMAAKAGSMAPMMIALLGATSIAFIFGVPVGPGAMALGGAILGTA